MREIKVNSKKIIGSLRIADISLLIPVQKTVKIDDELFDKSKDIVRLIEERKILLVEENKRSAVENFVDKKIKTIHEGSVRVALPVIKELTDKKILEKLGEIDSRVTIKRAVKARLQELIDFKEAEEL